MRTRLVAVASAALLFLLQGCTAAPGDVSDLATEVSTVDSQPGSTSTVEGSPEILDTGNAAAWCDLVPPATVEAALDTEVHEPTATFSTEEVHCTYRPVDDGGLTIFVQYILAS